MQAAAGGFQILGGHTYSRVGSFPVSVTIHHSDNSGAPNGTTATAPSQAHVTDAALTGAPSQITAVVGVPFAGPVASFSDPNPFAVASDFTATITWGDGAMSAGTIAASPSGFLITGSHTFASPGQIPVGVHIADSQGSTTSVQALAVVSPAPPPPRTTVTLSPASPTGRHGWYRGPVRASVSATTIIGAVVATRCQLDGAAPGSFDALPARCLFAGGGAQITADGKHVLYAASINDAGQKERPTATSVRGRRNAPNCQMPLHPPRPEDRDRRGAGVRDRQGRDVGTRKPDCRRAGRDLHARHEDRPPDRLRQRRKHDDSQVSIPSLGPDQPIPGLDIQVPRSDHSRSVARRRTPPTAGHDQSSLPRSRMSLSLTHGPSRQQTNMSAQELPPQANAKRDHPGSHEALPGLEPSRWHRA